MSVRGDPWRAAIAVLMCGLPAAAALQWAVVVALTGVWAATETYYHGWLVPLAVASLAWHRRDALARRTPSPSAAGPLLGTAAALVWIVGETASVNLIAELGFVLLIAAIVVGVLGVSIGRELSYALSMLLLMIPFGVPLVPLLMNATADSVAFAIRAVGIPIYREAMTLQLPSGTWSVIEACSGERYLVAAAFLAAWFAGLWMRNWTVRLLFIAVAFALSIMTNWIRAFLIILVGHFSDMRFGTGEDHVVYGWVLFAIMMYIVGALGLRWSHRDASASVPETPADSNERFVKSGIPRAAGDATRRSVLAFAVAAALALAPSALARGYAGAIARVQPRDFGPALVRRDFLLPGDPAVTPHVSGAVATASGELVREPGVHAYLAYFANQKTNGEMIAFGKSVVSWADPKWRIVERRRVGARPDESSSVDEFVLRAGMTSRVIWTWYVVGSHSTASPIRAKLLTAWSMLRGRGDHAMLVVLEAGRAPDARDRLARAAAAVNERALDFVQRRD